MIRIVIGMGTNLGDRRAHLDAAREAIAARLTRGMGEPASFRLASIYETPPLGPPQPDYFNSAVSFMTGQTPHTWLREVLAIEAEQGRIRAERWGARTLDLDLLTVLDGQSEVSVDTSALTLPHPGLVHRPFALAPLLEVLPELNMRYAPILAALGGPPPIVASVEEPGALGGYKGWTASAPAQ